MPGFGKDHWRVVLDGVEGKEFDFSTGTAGMGGISIGTPVFSPDGKHLAYAASIGHDACVVLDGVAGRIYSSTGILTFSPDSQHLAYVVSRIEGKTRLEHVARDGVLGKGYPKVLYDRPGDGLVFSSDSQHLAYAAVSRIPSSRSNDVRHCLVVDGLESKEFNQRPLGPLVFDSSTALHALAGASRIDLVLAEK